MRKLAFLGMLLVIAAGCDTERVSKLEKENQELKADLLKKRSAESATADYDLQAKCSRDAKGWFNENWPRDKDTILLDFTNHYNKSMNKCFISVEYHYHTDKNGSWTNDITLWDVYENAQYGTLVEAHEEEFKPEFKITEQVITCELGQKKCKTVEEFNGLVRPYMDN